jgi:hypothetical protein
MTAIEEATTNRNSHPGQKRTESAGTKIKVAMTARNTTVLIMPEMATEFIVDAETRDARRQPSAIYSWHYSGIG